MRPPPLVCRPSSYFFTDPAPTEIYTLSLHDALPIFALVVIALTIARGIERSQLGYGFATIRDDELAAEASGDRKSTRLNSSHRCISYAVFCLKKKNGV